MKTMIFMNIRRWI